MNTLINQNLGTTVDKVTAAEHRAVETAMLDYVAGQFIAGGEYHVGNGVANDLTQLISLGQTLANNQYMVLGNLVSIRPSDAEWTYDNDMMWCIEQQTAAGFTVRFGEWNTDDQDVEFHWVAIATPGVSPPTL